MKFGLHSFLMILGINFVNLQASDKVESIIAQPVEAVYIQDSNVRLHDQVEQDFAAAQNRKKLHELIRNYKTEEKRLSDEKSNLEIICKQLKAANNNSSQQKEVMGRYFSGEYYLYEERSVRIALRPQRCCCVCCAPENVEPYCCWPNPDLKDQDIQRSADNLSNSLRERIKYCDKVSLKAKIDMLQEGINVDLIAVQATIADQIMDR